LRRSFSWKELVVSVQAGDKEDLSKLSRATPQAGIRGLAGDKHLEPSRLTVRTVS
jgi:hypothetical protein